MSKEIITTTGRGIAQITAEIRVITGQARQYMAHTIIELGRRLTEAKALVPAGEWLEYLEKEVEYSESTAENYMRIFREYGDQQQDLFAPNSEALLNLPYTKLLRLLAVPKEERAEFAEAVAAEKISTRELEEAIAARQRAEEKAKEEQEKAEGATYREGLARDQMEKMQADLKAKQEKLLNLGKALTKAKEAEKKAKQEAEEAKEAKAQVPEDVMEQLRKDAVAAAKEQAQKDAAAAAAKAEEEVAAAKAEADKAREELEQAKKNAQLANPEAAVFKALFGQVQEDFGKLKEVLGKVETQDKELGGKLRNAVRALLGKLTEEVEK